MPPNRIDWAIAQAIAPRATRDASLFARACYVVLLRLAQSKLVICVAVSGVRTVQTLTLVFELSWYHHIRMPLELAAVTLIGDGRAPSN